MTVVEPKGLRKPRSAFEQILQKMLTKATSTSFFDLPWKSLYHPDGHGVTRLSVAGIWVAGSFARGATTCGDLDIILAVHKITGECLPTDTTMKRHILGIYPNVAVYFGTPDSNTSHVKFAEAVQLWTPERTDWQSALRSITVDETAGRYARVYDIIPLRREQFECRDYDFLVDLYEKKIIEWQWIPKDKIHKLDTENTRVIYHKMALRQTGAKTMDGLTAAISFLGLQIPPRFWHLDLDSKTTAKIGGYEVLAGKTPYVSISMLDRVQFSALTVIPHESRRGPNGLWIITRGREHPLVKFFNGLNMYMAIDEDGFPSIKTIKYSWETEGQLYTSKRNHCSYLGGNKLLESLAMVDRCRLNNKLYEYGYVAYELFDRNEAFLQALHNKGNRGIPFQSPQKISDIETQHELEMLHRDGDAIQ